MILVLRFKRGKQQNLFHYRLPNYTPVLCWDTHGWSEWGWMAGLGMPGASRLSSIWAGRCAEKKMTTQRARSPSGDQFMVLGLSLPVKKKISWCFFTRPALKINITKTVSRSLSHSFPLFSSLSPLQLFLLHTHLLRSWSNKMCNQICTHAQLHLRHMTTCVL